MKCETCDGAGEYLTDVLVRTGAAAFGHEPVYRDAMVKCDDCHGTGEASVLCPYCRGDGVNRHYDGSSTTCGTCHGEGEVR